MIKPNHAVFSDQFKKFEALRIECGQMLSTRMGIDNGARKFIVMLQEFELLKNVCLGV